MAIMIPNRPHAFSPASLEGIMFEGLENPEFEPELTVAIDVADIKLLGKDFEGKYQGKIDLCIDHHGSNNGYAKRLFLEADSASCCECVFEVVKMFFV